MRAGSTLATCKNAFRDSLRRVAILSPISRNSTPSNRGNDVESSDEATIVDMMRKFPSSVSNDVEY